MGSQNALLTGVSGQPTSPSPRLLYHSYRMLLLSTAGCRSTAAGTGLQAPWSGHKGGTAALALSQFDVRAERVLTRQFCPAGGIKGNRNRVHSRSRDRDFAVQRQTPNRLAGHHNRGGSCRWRHGDLDLGRRCGRLNQGRVRRCGRGRPRLHNGSGETLRLRPDHSHGFVRRRLRTGCGYSRVGGRSFRRFVGRRCGQGRVADGGVLGDRALAGRLRRRLGRFGGLRVLRPDNRFWQRVRVWRRYRFRVRLCLHGRGNHHLRRRHGRATQHHHSDRDARSEGASQGEPGGSGPHKGGDALCERGAGIRGLRDPCAQRRGRHGFGQAPERDVRGE